MVQRNKLLLTVHQNKNKKWVGIAARYLGMTQWETKGEKGLKAQEVVFFFFFLKGYGRCGGVV